MNGILRTGTPPPVNVLSDAVRWDFFKQIEHNGSRFCDVAVFKAQMLNTPPRPNNSNNVNNMQSSRHIAKPMLAAAAVKLEET